MSKLWLKHQKFLKGNAGFSLVELIIVIAIMAALIAILAPQYLKYVEKSRVAADNATADELLKAAQVMCVDETYSAAIATAAGATGADITFSATGITPAYSATPTAGSIAAALTESMGDYSTIKVKSSTYSTKTYSITFSGSSTAGYTASGAWA